MPFENPHFDFRLERPRTEGEVGRLKDMQHRYLRAIGVGASVIRCDDCAHASMCKSAYANENVGDVCVTGEFSPSSPIEAR